jgi:hypothetical protein
MLILMASPLLVSVALLLHFRPRIESPGAARLRGAWLLPAALVGSLISSVLHNNTSLPAPVINRGLAALIILICLCFVALNLRLEPPLNRAGVWLTTVGAAMNAAATLIFGYMPVLGSSAAAAGYRVPLNTHPNPRYVLSDNLGPFAVVVGDFMPLPGFLKVLSIGDLLLVPGCTILLACFLATLLPPRRSFGLGAADPRWEGGETC